MTDKKEKKDLTRIEDLSEFLHAEDEAADAVLTTAPKKASAEPSFDSIDFGSPDTDEVPAAEEPLAFAESDESSGPPTISGLAEESLLPPDFTNEAQGPEAAIDFGDPELPTTDLSELPDTPMDFAAAEQDAPASEALESELTSAESLDFASGPAQEEYLAPTPGPTHPPAEAPRAQAQNYFKDMQDFGASMSVGRQASGGNPPYGVIIRHIEYREDAQDILELLKELNIVRPDNEKIMERSLQNGALYLSQLSEYLAVVLTHKLRRFDVDVMMGLADELRPSPSETMPQKGLISKAELKLNFTLARDWSEQSEVDAENIMVSTSAYLENYIIQRHIGVANEQKIMAPSELEHAAWPSNTDSSLDTMAQNIQTIYDELKEKLKAQAAAKKANAILGLNYHLTNISLSVDKHGTKAEYYKITAIGNLVWVVDRPRKLSPEGTL